MESLNPHSGVAIAAQIALERFHTDGGIELARVAVEVFVVLERFKANGRVVAADRIAKQRVNAVGGVVVCGVEKERTRTVGRVLATICVPS